MDKIWKPLVYKGLDFTKDFLVSNYGEIYSLRTEKILHQSLNKSNGYYGICVSAGSRRKRKLIKPHIAVACAFVPGEKDGLVVNHIDGNKTNNKSDNLEWVTLKENSQHAIKNNLNKRIKRIRCLNNGKIFANMKEACIWCGLSKKANCLSEYFKKSSRKTAGKHPVTGEPLIWEIIE